MIYYFKDLDYNSGEILTTTDIEEAAHFDYEDQSSVACIPIIVKLLNLKSLFFWIEMRDLADDDQRYVIQFESK